MGGLLGGRGAEGMFSPSKKLFFFFLGGGGGGAGAPGPPLPPLFLCL